MYMDEFGYVLATRKVTDENLPVRFMYREKPDNEQDSGWRFFAGTETQEYADNADNIKIISVNEILKNNKSIAPLLSENYGTAFEKNDNTQSFVRVRNFSFGHDMPEV